MLFDSLNRSVTFISRLFDPHHPTEPLYILPQGKPDAGTGPVSHPLPRAFSEEVGISGRHLASFLETVANDPTLNMHNITVARKGKIILDFSFRGYDTGIWKYTFSACKSVTSLAVGILVGMGKLRVTDRLIDHLPDEELNPLHRLKLKDLTVEHLLTMTSGASFNELGSLTDENWLRSYLSGVSSGDIGKKFNYNSLNTYMLSWLVCRISGQSLSDFLTETLFSPIGIERFYWETDACGIEKGGWGLYIAPEEMVKLGMLVLQRGEMDGRQIVPAEYLDAATSAHCAAPNDYGEFDYGYQMWVGRNRDTVLFNGLLGQNLLIDRENGLIFMTNAGNDEMFQQGRYFPYLKQYFALSFPDSLPEDEEARKLLDDTIRSLAPHAELPKKKRFSSFFGLRFGKKKTAPDPLAPFLSKIFLPDDRDAEGIGLFPYMFQVIRGRYSQGLSSVSVERADDGSPVLVYAEKENVYRVPLGDTIPAIGSLAFGEENFLTGATYRVRKDEDDRDVLVIRIDFPETPHSRLLKLRIGQSGDGVLEQEELPGTKFLYETALTYKDDFAEQKLIGSAVQKIDDDYLAFIIGRCFSPRVDVIGTEKGESAE